MITGSSFEAHALLLGERINTRELAERGRIATTPLLLSLGRGGAVVVTRFGVLVFFGVPVSEREEFVASVRFSIGAPYEEFLTEALAVVVDPAGNDVLDGGRLIVHEASAERLQLIADVLSKSLVLESYERQVTTSFDQIEPLARRLNNRWRRAWRLHDLTAQIGSTLLTEQRMVGRVEIKDKPEVLWEHPELEGLYLRLFDEYELGERNAALEHKLDLITRTTETLLRLEESRRSLRAEWYIIILIVVEILLTLYELFLRH